MRDDFVSNLSGIVARHHEIYNVIVNGVFNFSQESYFTVDNVYALDLPPPPKGIPLPKTCVHEKFFELISPLLK